MKLEDPDNPELPEDLVYSANDDGSFSLGVLGVLNGLAKNYYGQVLVAHYTHSDGEKLFAVTVQDVNQPNVATPVLADGSTYKEELK